MATLLSETFLRVHPATALWWERRSSCESCKHLKLREGHEGEGVMRCTAVRVDQRASRDLLGAYCIDVRDEAGPCGPLALMWEGKE